MLARLVFDDWRDAHQPYRSIYATELGLVLSTGDLHSGTTWTVEIDFPEDLAEELRTAYAQHRAYAVFWVLPA